MGLYFWISLRLRQSTHFRTGTRIWCSEGIRPRQKTISLYSGPRGSGLYGCWKSQVVLPQRARWSCESIYLSALRDVVFVIDGMHWFRPKTPASSQSPAQITPKILTTPYSIGPPVL